MYRGRNQVSSLLSDRLFRFQLQFGNLLEMNGLSSSIVVESPERSEDQWKLVRPTVRGKFLFAGDNKLYIKGVTYGTFRPGNCGNEFHDAREVEQDFAQISGNGINTVRTYTVPPRWLLDLALQYGLRGRHPVGATCYIS